MADKEKETGTATRTPTTSLNPHTNVIESEMLKGERTARKAAKYQGDRKDSRLNAANERDLSILGESKEPVREEKWIPNERSDDDRPGEEYLDPRSESYFHEAIRGPDDSFDTPDWFLRELTKVANTETAPPKRSPIVFENTLAAAAENEKILKSVDFEMDRLISKYADTTLGYGSEFRTINQIKPLIGRHPHFGKLEKLLESGMPYIFKSELDGATKLNELQTILSRGNHKSARDVPEVVDKLLAKDVTHGFTIPIPIDIVPSIPGAAVQPLGIAQQWTMTEEGGREVKHRMTQDLSFSSVKDGPPRSINQRVDMSAYPEMVYGWCMMRILHYIVAVRLAFPDKAIFISKYDYSDAYRRIAHSAVAAAQTIAVHGFLAYLALRLTFGGAPNPPTWCMFSELVTDLANEISRCTSWDPHLLHSPAQPAVAPPPRRLGDDIPISRGRAMAVEVPVAGTENVGRVDGFIDDLINVFLDTPENCRRQPHVVPLAMHVTSRPHAGDDREPIVRRTLLSLPKLLAEGSPAEVQNVLGWRINTRSLSIALPDDKYRAWMSDIQTVIDRGGRCQYHELDTLAGRLNHSSFVMPASRHFLGRIRAPLTPRKSKSRPVTLSPAAVQDLDLWKQILASAHRGMSINLLVTREPNRICWSDACPFGLGGYSLSGRAWRIRIPPQHPLYGHSGVNNLLEFVAMVINVWLECLEPDIDQDCILAIGDRTSAIGWLFKSSGFDSNGTEHAAHLMVARHLASLLLKHNCCLASQHIRGELNVVADLLSFAGKSERGKPHPLAFDDPPNDILTNRFRLHLTSQVPENFRISQLPNEMLCWVTLVLQIAMSSLAVAKKDAMKEQTDSGDGGKASVATSGTETTPSSLCYPSSSVNFSSSPSSIAIGSHIGPPPGTLQESVRHRWYQALCAKPQANWLRRFGAISGKAPCTSREAPTSSPSSAPCLRHSKTLIPQRISSGP